MNKIATILAATCLFAAPVSAFAWNVGPQGPGTNAGSASDAGSSAAAAASSRSYTGASTSSVRSSNTNTVTVINSGSGANGHHAVRRHYVSHHYEQQVPVATAVAPSMLSYNSCAGSAAGVGIQGGTFGLSVGTGGGYDNACRLHELGQDDAAIAYLCIVNGDIRKAFKEVGRPCPEDRPRVRRVAVAPPEPVVRQIARRPDYCYTISRGDRIPPACR